jgi:hypothetical protein
MKILKFKIPLSIVLVVVMTLTFSSCEEKEELVAKPQNTISPKNARSLQKRFIRTRAAVLKDTLGYDDVRDVTFSLNDVEQYIKYVKQQMPGTDPADIDLRIFFGTNPPSAQYKEGLSTIFMAPIVKSPTQQGGFFMNYMQTGLDPLNKGTGGMPPNDY